MAVKVKRNIRKSDTGDREGGKAFFSFIFYSFLPGQSRVGYHFPTLA